MNIFHSMRISFILVAIATVNARLLRPKDISRSKSNEFSEEEKEAFSIINKTDLPEINGTIDYAISRLFNASQDMFDQGNLSNAIQNGSDPGIKSSRFKRAVPVYNPFNFAQLFSRAPSPLDIGNRQNGLDALIKRGLSAINDLSIFSPSKNDSDKEKTRSAINNVEQDSDSQSIGNVLKGQIQNIQARLNGLASEMTRFIQTITQSTSRLFLPQQQQPAIKNPPTAKNGKTNPQNIFTRWFL